MMQIFFESIPWYKWLVLFFVWISGGLLSIFYLAYTEKRRLGGSLTKAIISDWDCTPLAVIVGYICVFITSWLSLLYHIIFEERIVEK